MGWVEVNEPFVAPPNVASPTPRNAWVGAVEFDGGWCEVAEASLADTTIEGEPGDRLVLTGSTLRDVVVDGEATEIEAFRTSFSACDLSRVRFPSLRAVTLVDCKLAGADLAVAELTDVVFERCVFRYVNLRMTRLRRVAFVDCTMHEIDAYNLDAEDVSFNGCDLEVVNLDRLRAARVDFRGARRLGIDAIGSLGGCLVAADQLHGLTHLLAFAAGLGVERSRAKPTDDTGDER